MGPIIILSFACFFGWFKSDKKQEKMQEVRITYYWPGDSGQRGTRTSTGKRAKSLKTCAVDPKIFPYGSEIEIPEMDLTLVANDTGGWVKSRKAAKAQGKNVPVIDIFVKNSREARKMQKKYPMFMKIKVKKQLNKK